ncbi:MAG: hypothetical protein XD78_1040 [Desulfotomaculum sp. 46_296]|nr:MAG: hypothetical protein XD78_1040 [Desulfotomaculum sp. 46_296]
MVQASEKKNVQIAPAPGTSKPCSKCKWGRKDSRDSMKGFCVGYKTKGGTPWVRKIKDFENTTCGKYEEGIPGIVNTVPLPDDETGGKINI